MKNKDHLPLLGPGPIYVISILIPTVIFMVLSFLGYMKEAYYEVLTIPFYIIGSLLIIYGLVLWTLAVLNSKIDKNIEDNKLVTTGIYRYCRNPIYMAFVFIFTGALLFTCNLYLFILPPIYYIYLTILMIHTEEKWLKDKFKYEYLSYMRETNRCFPWFPNKK